MTEALLRKRDREPEVLPDHNDVQLPKRVHGEENNRFLHLLQFHKTLDDNEEEPFAPSEELVNRFIRRLEEEIARTCSSSSSSSNSGDNSAAADIFRGHEGETVASKSGFDRCYLLEASDDELGIPPNPVLDIKDEDSLSTKETSNDLLASLDLKSLGENWHFEDDFQNYQQIAVYDDPWNASQLQNYMNRDFVSQSMLLNRDFSATWDSKVPLACNKCNLSYGIVVCYGLYNCKMGLHIYMKLEIMQYATRKDPHLIHIDKLKDLLMYMKLEIMQYATRKDPHLIHIDKLKDLLMHARLKIFIP